MQMLLLELLTIPASYLRDDRCTLWQSSLVGDWLTHWSSFWSWVLVIISMSSTWPSYDDSVLVYSFLALFLPSLNPRVQFMAPIWCRPSLFAIMKRPLKGPLVTSSLDCYIKTILTLSGLSLATKPWRSFLFLSCDAMLRPHTRLPDPALWEGRPGRNWYLVSIDLCYFRSSQLLWGNGYTVNWFYDCPFRWVILS